MPSIVVPSVTIKSNMLSVVMLNVTIRSIMLILIIVSVIMPDVTNNSIMMIGIMLSVVMLNAIQTVGMRNVLCYDHIQKIVHDLSSPFAHYKNSSLSDWLFNYTFKNVETCGVYFIHKLNYWAIMLHSIFFQGACNRNTKRERDQTYNARALHSQDHFTWFWHMLKAKS
jgi:hypothetical protein